MAQCCMAICMQKPDFARARPSTLLEDNASYDKLYNRANDVSSYYVAALVGKRVEEYLKSKDGISLSDRNNMKFYIILCVAILLTGNKYPGFRSISNISSTDITENVINKAFNFVDYIYTTIGREDKSAKGPDMISAIKQNSDSLISP